MPRKCSICSRVDRAEIDRAAIAGAPYRSIARQFHTGAAAVLRHKAEHLLAELVKAKQAEDVAQADDLLAQLLGYRRRADALLDKAEHDDDYRSALSAIREARSCLELEAKLRGELDERAQVNVLLAPEWLAVREVLLAALWPYVEARQAVAAALVEIEGGQQRSVVEAKGSSNGRFV
jgi:hypothetical protein